MWCVAARLRDALSIVGRILLLALLVSLSSCVKPTVFPRYLTVADVIHNVKCELYLALWEAIRENPKATWLDDWAATFSVILQVTRKTDINGDFTFVVPYNAPVGLFTLVVGGKADKSGQSRVTFSFLADKDLKTFREKAQCDYWQQLNSRNNLAGETGLRLWFGNLIDGINQADISEQSTSLIYTLQFVTTLNGNIKPSFRSMYPSNKIFSGTFGIGRTRTDDNKLTVAFSPPVPAAPVFAATELGKALARIEDALEKVEQEKPIAEVRLNKETNAFNAFRDSKGPQGFQALRSRDPAELRRREKEFEDRVGDAQKRVDGLSRTITNLKKAKEDVRAGAAAAAAVPAGRVATEQRLNQLLVLDAIRDIPR